MLRLENIVKDYVTGDTTVRALKGITLSFRRNEFVSILGPSGCGKTTMLNIIGGLDRYTSGDLFIEGKSTKTFKSKDWDAYRNRCIGFVFQNYNLIPHLTVLGNVEMALTLSGVSKPERKRLAEAALEKVGLSGQINKRPNQLSGGQMQRVAIARALVNDPEVILADEPTGALDSVTSVQISDLLHEIAKDRLVIMVTHNRELAEKYSTRIIEVLDGSVVQDSNPYAETAEEFEQEEKIRVQEEPVAAPIAGAGSKPKKNKTSMAYTTALSLSFKNLITKKGRTFMTAFAGSIGIIGIALVLAISNGFTHYIDKMQSDTLSGYPLSIAAQAVDFESAMQKPTDSPEKFPGGSNVNVQYPSNTLFHTNVITDDFIQNYVKKLDASWYNTVSYSYTVTLNVLALDADGKPQQLKAEESHNPMDMMTGSSASFWAELLEKDYVLEQYDVLAGDYPETADGLVLVVDKYNRISSTVLEMLNIDPDGAETLKFEDLLGRTFKLIENDDYYELKDGKYQARTIDREMYDGGETLKIDAILRIKENASMDLFSTGLMYTPELTRRALDLAKDSEIALAQAKSFSDGTYTDVRTGKSIYESYKNQFPDMGGLVDIDTIVGWFLNPDKTPEDIQKDLQLFNIEMSVEEIAEVRQLFENQKTQTLRDIGAVASPASIQIYPKNFESKELIKAQLAGYNTDRAKNEQIFVTDMASILTDTMTNMVDIISYVLVAFAAVSLVVSSIMIGIITYVSVIERTKEIGVLRSLGARKKDISRVFNAETLIIGLAAGLIGVFVAFILTFPINAIITHLASGMVTNMAILNPLHALLLVVISMALTLISGFIPSRIAAKRDPVVALRSE